MHNPTHLGLIHVGAHAHHYALAPLPSPAQLLQGVLFHDRMKPSVLETVRPELVALEEAFLAEHPAAKVQRLAPAKGAKGFGAPKK